MKALVLKKNKELVYTEVAGPEKIKETSLLVKITAAGICGSDLHRGFGGGAYHYPLIMGHECAGVVDESRPGSRFKKGDRVTIFPLLPCHRCEPCRSGDYAQCTDYDYFGSRRNGAFAEYLYVPEENLFLLPDHVQTLHAALTEPCAVALHGINKLRVRPGKISVVYGGGPIGNIAAQWLRIHGCEKVIVVEIDPPKLALARDLGFVAFDPRAGDPLEFILQETDGRGADCVVEACGLPLTFLQAVQSAGRFGEVLFMGNISGDFTIGQKDFSGILRKELTIHGTWNSKIMPPEKNDWNTVLCHLDRELKVAPLVSHTPPLKDGVEVFARLLGKKEFFNKVVFTID